MQASPLLTDQVTYFEVRLDRGDLGRADAAVAASPSVVAIGYGLANYAIEVRAALLSR